MRSLSAPSRGNVTPAQCRLSFTKMSALSAAVVLGLAFALVITAIAPIAAADDATTQPEVTYYSVDFFAPVFETRPGQPTADAAFQANLSEIIGDTEVELGISDAGYIAPEKNIPTANRKISELNVEGVAQFSQGAILTIDKAIVRNLNAHGYGAVLVVPSPNDIDPQDLSDLRSRKKGTMHLLISVPTAAEVRTVASGDRISTSETRIDNPKQKRIIHNSPIQPSTEPSGGSSFFNQDVVNDYVDRLNRQPGRRVDVALSAADEPDQYTLDYLINEIKPWYAYAQVSNTGTSITGTWRERFGVVDNQLSGNDDILSIDGVTDFNQSTNITGSYEFPLFADNPSFGTDRLRARVYGLWDQYQAADIGQLNDTFSGSDYSGGAEIAYNVYQKGNLFVDFIFGARYQNSQVKSQFQQTSASADYIIPYVGPRLEDYQPTFDVVAALNAEGGVTSANKTTLAEMGRANPDPDFIILQPNVQGSFYLEPLLDYNNYNAGRSTLANELYFSFSGQWSLGYRLIPQFEQAAGGFYSVRGYPEAIVAGDSVFLGTAEYRFHIARALGVAPNPTKIKVFGDPFRVLPEQPYQRPDWDCIVRGFLDLGQTLQSSKITGENNDALVGVGAGVEFQIRQNIDIRGDYGIALAGLSNTGTTVKVGSSRFTLVVTLLY
jgi:hemolysin activation/secretion protein